MNIKPRYKSFIVAIHWRIQHYCEIHGGEHPQNINIKSRHNTLLIIFSENFAVPLYTPLDF